MNLPPRRLWVTVALAALAGVVVAALALTSGESSGPSSAGPSSGRSVPAWAAAGH